VLQEMLQRIVVEAKKRRLQVLVSRSSLSSEERAEIRQIQEFLRKLHGNFDGP